MRRLAALLMLTLLLAAPAGAQEARRLDAGKAPAAGALRGSEPEAPADGSGTDGLAALVPLPPPVAPVGSRTSSSARQCRAACAREYYFCLAGEDEICPQVWTKCTAGCGA